MKNTLHLKKGIITVCNSLYVRDILTSIIRQFLTNPQVYGPEALHVWSRTTACHVWWYRGSALSLLNRIMGYLLHNDRLCRGPGVIKAALSPQGTDGTGRDKVPKAATGDGGPGRGERDRVFATASMHFSLTTPKGFSTRSTCQMTVSQFAFMNIKQDMTDEKKPAVCSPVICADRSALWCRGRVKRAECGPAVRLWFPLSCFKRANVSGSLRSDLAAGWDRRTGVLLTLMSEFA